MFEGLEEFLILIDDILTVLFDILVITMHDTE